MDIEILHEPRLRYWGDRLGFPSEATEVLVEVNNKIQQDAALLEIIQSFYEKNVLRGEWNLGSDDFPIDPYVTEKLGDQDTLFYLIAHMAALPHLEQDYIRRGIDLAIFVATIRDIRLWLMHYWTAYGKWMFRQFPWVTNHLSGNLFRLGRMQYVLSKFDDGVTAIKNTQNGQILLLADPETPLRDDGYAHGAGDLPQPETSWKPIFESLPNSLRGQVVSPLGCVLPEISLFSRLNWETILTRGDTILEIHIPRGDSFSVDDCRDSLRQASAFFARYFPDRPYKAGYCHTWFFSPQLQTILPPESNIVRFQREFYLFPFAGKLSFLWFYVFGERVAVNDLKNAPDQTSLQRVVLKWLENGGEIFDLPGLIFHSADLWGSQPYMRAWEQQPTVF